jgi:formylmethanofuran dehydrogenase subunit A
VIPIEYRPQRSLIHAVQWAIALEWYLLMEDPWRVVMTSDHPNGGAFYHYPEIIYLLMDKCFRDEFLSQMPEAIRERSVLADLTREYSLYEIAIITRAAPARVLGMKDKGHLGTGAHADITIYAPQQNRQEMFERPRWVFKDGEMVVADGEIQAHHFGRTFFTAPEFDQEFLPQIKDWFNDNYSIRFGNYQIDEGELPLAEKIACTPE